MKQTELSISKMTLCLAVGSFLFFNAGLVHLNAQGNQAVTIGEKQLTFTRDNIDSKSFDEAYTRKKMKEDGLTDPVIDKLIAQRKLMIKKGQAIGVSQAHKNGQQPPPSILGSCTDMGVENGWAQWSGAHGTNSAGNPPTWNPAATNPPPVPTANNLIRINTGAGTDPCTPGAAVGAPAIPLVAPGFGASSIQLGVNMMSGCYAEQIIFPLTVGPNDTNFVYTYAMVLHDPVSGHGPTEKPFVEFMILDANGDTLPCSYQHYVAGPNLPGFFTTAAGCTGYPDSWYKPWTNVGVNLSNYVGQNLTVVITNGDCVFCGHYAQSYWDFNCGVLTTNPSSYCQGQAVTITAPNDPLIAYTYQWTQNGNPYTGAPSATSPFITPFPVPGDTFEVSVQQPSGCNFHLVYVPAPMSITPNFSSVSTCGVANFTDLSTAPNGIPIISWNWSFPGGSPANSTSQNPTGITYPAGNYTVTLIATAQSGCIDTISLPITITGLPQAAFASSPVCAGLPTQFTNNSVAGVGDPIVSTSWSFPGGNPATSTASNPVVVYPAGNYTATLTVTSQQGCVSTVTQQVVVNPLPLANLSGINVCFNNLNTFTDLSTGNSTVSNWDWNFGDGNTATTQNPTHTYGNPGTYTVSLIVTNNFGCKDTNQITVVVNPLPVSNFSSQPVCLHDTTCFSDLSTVSTGAVTGWSWNFGDPNSGANNISNLQNPCHQFTGLGPFTVILTVTSDSGCQSTTNLQALINPLPVAAISVSSVCLNVSTSFTDQSTSPAGDPVVAWNWDFGDGSPASTQQNPSHTYAAAGNYTVTLIVTTQKGCKDTVPAPVVVYNPPVANFTAPASGCSPVINDYTDISTSIDGTVSAWEWSFPGGIPALSNTQNPQNITYSIPGSYSASLIITTSFGCKDTISLPMINVYPWPNAEFCVAPSQAPVTDPVFNFCDLWSSDVVQWSWSFGDGTMDSSNTDPSHSYAALATNNDFYTYNICLNVQNQYGCWDTICHVVELIPEYEFYIPNCFTPNQDFVNEFFFGKCRGVKEYNIWVFDRWGNMLWDCHKEDKNTNWDNQGQDGLSSACKWDGKVVPGGMDMSGRSNQFGQEDVYVWKVRLTDIFDKKHMYVGHVSIVK